jgi:hypothetical protein
LRAAGAVKPSCPAFFFRLAFQFKELHQMENDTLIDELSALWESETGLTLPYPGAFKRWLASAQYQDVQSAIRKTGRAVKKAAGGDRPFVTGPAVSYCSNVLGNRVSARSATVAL